MTESSKLGDLVQQNVDGQSAANGALFDIAHTIPAPDLLHERLQAVLVTAEPERLRAFMRTLQKRLEAAAA